MKDKILLDIGCGMNKKQGYLGIDKVKLQRIDIISDIEHGLPFKDNAIDGIRVIQVLEHVRDLIFVLEDFWRVCKEGAEIEILVPYWNRVGAFRDPTHVRFFTYRTFDHFTENSRFPNYYSKIRFEIAYRRIKFAKSKKQGVWLLLYIWETFKDKFANRFPDIYENTWLKIFSARHLEVRLIVKKDKTIAE